MIVLLHSVLLVAILSGIRIVYASQDVGRKASSNFIRRHRAANDTGLHFEPEPYNRKLELNSSGKIHCKVTGGVSPIVQWYLNDADPLPEGITSVNGTLLVPEAARRHAGQYTCKAVDGDRSITSKITLDVVVSPRVVEPEAGLNVQATVGQTVVLNCRALGDPTPTTHWDRNLATLNQQSDVDLEDGVNASIARLVVLKNGSLVIRNVSEQHSDRYGCTAGSAAGLARNELILTVLPPATQETSGVGGKAVIVSISVAAAYMVLVLVLMLYCRKRRLKRRQRGEKMELELVEGQEKLVEDVEENKIKTRVTLTGNGKLSEKDSDVERSDVSIASRESKKSLNLDRLAVPRTMLKDKVVLGRGEFGEVFVAKVDKTILRSIRNKTVEEGEPKIRPALVIKLTSKDEDKHKEFRRQMEVFGKINDTHVCRLIGVCLDSQPNFMLLEHTEWGDLKSFLISTRTEQERVNYKERTGLNLPSDSVQNAEVDEATRMRPLSADILVMFSYHVALAGASLANAKVTHRDIGTRNCVLTPNMVVKLSCPALTRSVHSDDYHKLDDKMIPLRWLPLEAVDGEHTIKSDVYMVAATIWEIYTKAEMPFADLGDETVLEQLRSGTLEWKLPGSMPPRMQDLVKRCWCHNPTDRPSFYQLCQEIQPMLNDFAAGHLVDANERIES